MVYLLSDVAFQLSPLASVKFNCYLQLFLMPSSIIVVSFSKN